MPVLTGRLAYVTGSIVPTSAIRNVAVHATRTRSNGSMLITTRPVAIDPAGTLTVKLESGPAYLTLDLDGAHNTIDLLVSSGTKTFQEAARAASEAKGGK